MLDRKLEQKNKLTYKNIEKLKVDASKLEEGMYVCELDRPWEDSPFVFQGFLLRNARDVATVAENCEWVYIDVVRSIHMDPKKRRALDSARRGGGVHSFSTVTVDKSGASRKPLFSRFGKIFGSGRRKGKGGSGFTEALKPAVETRIQTDNLVKTMMSDIRMGKSIDTRAAKEAVASCVDNVMMNRDAALLLTRLRNKDEYTSEHSLNVAIISIAFGRHMGMNRAQLNEVGLCGLMHDMGKMLTPDEVLNKPGRLTDDEMDIMKRHPADGKEILLATQDVMDHVIDTAWGHHERLNGSGYPRGVDAADIPLYTRMVTIADVFDAITGDRVYRKGETAEKALSIIHRESGKFYDESLVIKFIENIGTYPLGTIVELHNGEIGIVVENSPTHRLRPKVKLLLTEARKRRLEPRIVDLSKPDRDEQNKPYMIKTSHMPGSFRIDLSQHVKSYVGF